jgi:hypothetical protein
MNWGKSIVLSFVLFAAFIGVLVVVCVRQDVNLVSEDYYKEELAYQEQIERIKNADQLSEKPTLTIAGESLEVTFAQFNRIENGDVRLFRPSDARLDRHFVLQPSTGIVQRFDVRGLPKGMYHAKMKWSMNGKEYYVENSITL